MGMEYLDRVVEVRTFDIDREDRCQRLRRSVIGQVRLAPRNGKVLVDTGRYYVRVPLDQLDSDSLRHILACGRSETEPSRCECEDSDCGCGGRCNRIGQAKLDGTLLCRTCLMHLNAQTP